MEWRGIEDDDIEKFFKACIDGNVEQVQNFIRRRIDANVVRNISPLLQAACYGHVDVEKVLIQNGADVNAVDKDKMTPLHWAAYYGHVDLAKVLIQNGADVNAIDKDKCTPFHNAARWGDVDVAKVLIQNGADVNAIAEEGWTALHIAATKAEVVFALQLLCFGAAIDENALDYDQTGLLGPINERMNLLRAGKRPETSLMSNEERRFMWNLAFSLTIQHPSVSFKVHYRICSFITFHGIFMVDGYNLGERSVWKM